MLKTASPASLNRTSLAAILGFLGLGILIVTSYPSLIIAEKIPPTQKPEMGEVKVTRASLQITNPCPQPHYFRVTSDIKDPGFKQQTDTIRVRAKMTEKIEVLMDPAESEGRHVMNVECLDCKKEDGCTQERQDVPIEMTTVMTVLKGKTPGPALSPKSLPVLSRQNGPNDVGIIPETSGGCPIGSEFIIISLDDEDHNNASSVAGWVGDISHYSTGTTFGFCRVDGNQFHSLPTRDYAVLQLGSTCPNGSKSTVRIFDDEHGGTNNNWFSGNISPSSLSNPPQACMSFCFFAAGTNPTMSAFPSLHVPYGVFAAPPSLVGLPTGTVHTDDEDSSNTHDYTCAGTSCSTSNCSNQPYLNNFAKIIYGTENGTPLAGKNTNLLVTKVANAGPCNQQCPYMGLYDGANCWVGGPPAGTHAFIWANNFYYTPVNGNQCPLAGTWYDGANCFVTAISPQTTPFIWANMWYVEPVCR